MTTPSSSCCGICFSNYAPNKSGKLITYEYWGIKFGGLSLGDIPKVEEKPLDPVVPPPEDSNGGDKNDQDEQSQQNDQSEKQEKSSSRSGAETDIPLDERVVMIFSRINKEAPL